MLTHIKSTIAALVAGISILAAGPGLSAGAQNPQTYSAIAIHALPGQEETYGKIVKSGQNLRLEFRQDGRDIIQILRPSEGAMYILDPYTKSYFEVLGPAVPKADIDGYQSPCPNQTESPNCQKLGVDTVNGVPVERWAMTSAQDQKPLVILWDSTRRRALRQDFPTGGSMIMAFKSMEDLNGRTAEHWAITLSLPGMETQTGDWWFDPKLRVAVRENLPSGESRSLKNIVVGPVDPANFQIPAGWAKQDVPAPGTQ